MRVWEKKKRAETELLRRTVAPQIGEQYIHPKKPNVEKWDLHLNSELENGIGPDM